MLKHLKYPPGIDRRTIDWVRFKPSVQACSNVKCREYGARETEVGTFCLMCYKKLQTCDYPGCHRPAMDSCASYNRKKLWIPTCRIHSYNEQKEADTLEAQRNLLFGGSSYSNDVTY